MNRRILDTNVIVNAHATKSPQTSESCISQCQHLLVRCMADHFQIVIDVGKHGSDVLREYQNNLPYYGGSYGELFIRWLLNNITDKKHVFEVPLTRQDADDEYEEFPDDPDLVDFDPRDRKFVALGVAHYMYEDEIAPIVQSADYKWRDFVVAFRKHYVHVDFLCDEKNDAR